MTIDGRLQGTRITSDDLGAVRLPQQAVLTVAGGARMHPVLMTGGGGRMLMLTFVERGANVREIGRAHV